MKWDLTNEKDIKKLTKRIEISYKKIRGHNRGSDDCVQEVLEHYISGKGERQTVDQAVIDYLRGISGRKGLPSYIERQNLEHAHSLESPAFKNISNGCSGLDLENRLDAIKIVELSRHWERAVMRLIFVEGYGQAEVGNFFGVSESRVNQWIKRIQKRISARIKAQESFTESKRAREMEKILLQKTKGNEWGVEQISFEKMEIGQSWGMASFDEASF